MVTCPLVREWSPPVATGGLAGAPLQPARLALLNRDRLDIKAGHGGVACFGLPKPRHPCPWDVNAAAVLDSSKRELAALPFLFIISYCRRCRPDLIAYQHSRLSCWWQSCPRDHFFTRDRLCIGPVSCLAAVQKFKARLERVTSVVRGRSKVDVGGSHCSWQCAFIRRSTPNWRIDVSSIHLGEH
jgi:hypothetical protein